MRGPPAMRDPGPAGTALCPAGCAYLIDAKHRMVAGIRQSGETRGHGASADLPVGRDDGCPVLDRYLARLEGLHPALAGERGLAGRSQIADPVRFAIRDRKSTRLNSS